MNFTIKGVNPDDSIGALVIRYVLTLTETTNNKTYTSSEKAFTVYGFRPNVSPSTVDNASVNFQPKTSLSSTFASRINLTSF